MAWFKVDDGFYTSHKVLQIPRNMRRCAIGAWLMVGTWSADKMTDGHVPSYVVDDFGVTEDEVEMLITVGLWERTEDGIYFANWCEYQPTREQLEAKREAVSERRSEAGKKSGEARRNKREQNANKTEQTVNPEPEPEPYKSYRSSDDEPVRAKTPYSDDFEQFWSAYPRKQAKGKAWEVYKRLKRTGILPSLDVLIEAAKNYELATRHDPQFQKLCEGWLNGHRWQDEPIPQPFTNAPPKRDFTTYRTENV